MSGDCQAAPTTLSGDIADEARQVCIAAAGRLMADEEMQFMIDLGTSMLVMGAAGELSNGDISVSLSIEHAGGLLCACDWVAALADRDDPEERSLYEMSKRVWHQVCGSPMEELNEAGEQGPS